jgi:hypothetical protein
MSTKARQHWVAQRNISGYANKSSNFLIDFLPQGSYQ